jgi:glutathione synthase/RimK-type ligase-like ATP-grasp enzyme
MILAIAYEGEEHTAGVLDVLRAEGREVVQVDMGDFPANHGVSLSWSGNADASYRVHTKAGDVDLTNVGVGWWRRVRPFVIDPAIRKPMDAAFVQSETSQAVNGMLDALDCAWVNPREADTSAHHKPYQWAVAQRLGLRMPRTLVTNDPGEAKRFIEEIGVGKVVFKAFLASVEDWRETRLVEAEDVERLELVRYSPVIFQEYIPGVDLRITVVGDQIFTGEIDAQKTSYPVDMRMVVGESKMQAIELPKKLSAKLLALQKRLQLVYGAIDMRRTPDGEYYFLEVNPAGQWHFVEHRTGLQITKAMAGLLARYDDAKRVAAKA